MPELPSCDTVFLLGSGIGANSWVPVIAGIHEFYPTVGVTSAERANFWLAWWVYAQRTRGELMRRGDLGDERADTERRNRELEASDLGLRQTIAANIRVATEQDFFRLRRQAVRVLGDWQLWGRSRYYLTTNWDRLLETELAYSPKSVMHIHGDVEMPSCLYLPTETSTEPYRKPDINEHIGALTGMAAELIRRARQLCIYGLSLSPLDAELGAILGAGLDVRPGPPFPVYVCNVAEAIDEMVWKVRAALHPESKLDIRPMVIEKEQDPPVPAGWDFWKR